MDGAAPAGMDGITELIDQHREIAVYDDVRRARDARQELIAAGYRQQEIAVLDAEAAALTRLLEGPPIPEMIAGAIAGAFLASTLAFHPGLAPLLDPFGPTFVPIIGIGALLGAVVSYVVADRSRPAVIKRDVGPGEYVVVVPVSRSKADRVHDIIKRYGPRALERAA